MNFLSVPFALLMLVLVGLLAVARGRTLRTILLLAACCAFYAGWDWRFLAVLAALALLNYYVGLCLAQVKDASRKKALLWAGVAVNLLVLGYFKYANFFLDSLKAVTGGSLASGALDIIAPLGISFITFENLSYLFDVANGVLKAEESLLDYAVFVLFFPRIVSGPIMRARNFLPQLKAGFFFTPDDVFAGAQLFLRGLLKKLVVADSLAVIADRVYTSPSLLSSWTVWLGVLAYSVQILCDFSGYTDMALGAARMIGFRLPVNFNLPYTAQSITEFWQRWHMTLSTWFRDYLFYPLERARKGKHKWISYANLLATMLVCGLWHGTGWNFVVWGGLLGLYLAFERRFLNRWLAPRPWTSSAAWLRSAGVFLLMSLTWIPFRSPDWSTTGIVLRKLAFTGFPYGFDWYYAGALVFIPLVFIGGLLAARFKWEWPLVSYRRYYAAALILAELLIVFFFAQTSASPFIYSQF